MKKTFFFIVLTSCLLSLQAQPLRSVGPVPADLKMSVQQLYESDVYRAEQYAGGRVRDKQQLLEASYRINKMLAGGHILYGDSVTLLVNRIADTLLRDYPQLRSELRFYTVTSPDVNAFTTPQGMIFVNVGLIAQVENEAQLAFIIAHEIIHYYRAHGMETLVGKNGKKKRSSDLDDEAERAGDFLRKHNRSHEMENEADSLGIVLFYAKSPYWKDVTEGVFDVLQYSELPFDELSFDTNYFNTPYYRLTGCWLDTVADITSRDNYDDSRSSHPNILKRRQRTAAALASLSGGEKYLITSQPQFERLRHIARMECIRQDLLHGNYPRAFYNSWVLSEAGNQSSEVNIQRFMAQALYGMAVFKCNEKTSDVIPDYEKIEGESQQVYYAFKQMSAEQSTLVTLHKVWNLHLRYPREKTYTDMAHHLMELLHTKCQKSASDFLDNPPEESGNFDLSQTTGESDSAAKPLTKYERIKQKRKTQTRQNPTTYALADLMQADSAFAAILAEHLDDSHPHVADSVRPNLQKDAMLVFNPSYWVVDRHEELRTAKSDACEEDLVSRITGIAGRLGIRTVDFSDQGMHGMTTAAQYNDFLTVCEWMNEFWLTKGLFHMHRLQQPAMDYLLSRYNSRTLNMTAILNVEGRRGPTSLAYAILLPLAPVAISSALTGLESTTMVSIVVDAHEGRMLTRQVYHYNVADHSALVEAMLHDTYVRTTRTNEPKGHLGHRFALAGGITMAPAGLQNFRVHQYVAFTPWVSTEFALSRNFSLAATARYQAANTSVNTSRNMLTFGLELRHYKNSDFAPYGYYIDYGLHLTNASTVSKSASTNIGGIHLGIGRNYILYRHFLINYQIDYGYTYGITKVFGFREETSSNQQYGDAILSNLLTIKFGIGFLPF